MKLFILPIPIFNTDMGVHAYLFLYQKYDNLLPGGQIFSMLDGSFNNQILELIDKLGIDAFTNGAPVIVPISNINLLLDLEKQCGEPAEQIIFLIDKTVTPEAQYIDRIKRFKDLGYTFALTLDKDFDQYNSILALCDYILINQDQFEKRRIPMSVLMHKHLKIAAMGVKGYVQYYWALSNKYTLFEGSFYRTPVTYQNNSVSPLKVNSIQLLNLIRQDDFDIDELTQIVKKDTSLAISLLRLINSPHLGLTQKIKTINQAAALLGQKELRKWVSTAVASSLALDKPTEITRLTLIRAKFSENIAPLFHMDVHAQSLFLMGLFSALDAILEMDLSDAFELVQVSDEIKDALVNSQGPYYPIFELILKYEQADFHAINRIAILNSLDVGRITTAYLDAVTWYSQLIYTEIETDALLNE